MKKIIGILISLIMCITLSSCVTTASAQVDDMYDDVDISVVVTYGTPFYNTEGLVIYYLYRNMFYYPYYYHNRYYLHRYSRPLPPNRLWRYRPVHRDFYKNYQPPRGRVGNFRLNEPPRRGNAIPNNPPRRINTTPTQPQRPNVRPTQPQVRPNTNVNVRPTQPQVRSTQPQVRSIQPQAAPRSNSNGNFGGARRR